MAGTLKFIAANNAATTVGSTVAPGDTTITVATGTGGVFPTLATGQQFSATLVAAGSTTGVPNEIVYCTAISGDTLTVVRAREGSTAQSWQIGASIANLYTAGQDEAMAQLVDVQQQDGNWAADTGSANVGVVTLSPIPISLASIVGMPIRVLKGASPNSGAYTLNVNGLGAVAVDFQGSAVIANDLLASQFFTVVYDGAVFELISPPGVAVGGPPSGAAGGDLTGTYPNPTVGTNKITNAKAAQAGAGTLKGNLTGGLANVADNALATVEAALTLAGDVTGAMSSSLIAADAVTNAKMALVPADTLKGSVSAGPANPQDLTVAQVITLLGLPIPSPPNGSAGGDLSGTYPNPSVAANAVSNAKQAQMSGKTIKANANSGSSNPQDVTIPAFLGMLGLTGVAGPPGHFELPLDIGGNVVTFILEWGTLGSVSAGSITTVTLNSTLTTFLGCFPTAEGDGGSTDNATAQYVTNSFVAGPPSTVQIKLQNVTSAPTPPAQVVRYLVIGIK